MHKIYVVFAFKIMYSALNIFLYKEVLQRAQNYMRNMSYEYKFH